ncbi:MAG: transcription antitermination factor NusB [Actinomycetota bacterium]|nr:transcription antitermination factor NusB [Actinomycetota bacterium]
MMLERRKARKDALEILYEKEITGQPLDLIIENRLAARGEKASGFTIRLVKGVEEHREQIDNIIRTHTDNWALERMPIVDRNLIRIGLYEMLYEEDIPYSVSINEAVELAKIYGMEESSRFINGVLGKVASELKESGVKKAGEEQDTS